MGRRMLLLKVRHYVHVRTFYKKKFSKSHREFAFLSVPLKPTGPSSIIELHSLAQDGLHFNPFNSINKNIAFSLQ